MIQIKYFLFLGSFLLFSLPNSLFGVGVTINSFGVVAPGGCVGTLNIVYNVDITGAGDDMDILFPGDLLAIILRDGDCNVFIHAEAGFVNGTGISRDVQATFGGGLPAPVNGYWTMTIHDICEIGGGPATIAAILNTVPLATLIIDHTSLPPSSICDILPTVTTTPSCPMGTAVVSCFNPIPTMSQWGLIVLGLALTIFGVSALRQRKLLSSNNR